MSLFFLDMSYPFTLKIFIFIFTNLKNEKLKLQNISFVVIQIQWAEDILKIMYFHL